MNCTNCNGRMVQYQGFDERGPSGNYECMAGCKTTKAPEMEACGDDGTWQYKYRYYAYGKVLDGELNIEQYCGAVNIINLVPFPPDTIWGNDYTIDFTPIRSELAQLAQEAQANLTTVQIQHRPLFHNRAQPDPRGGWSQSDQDQDLDDQDQCSSLQQGSHPPRKLDTPTKLSPSFAQCVIREIEQLDRGENFEFELANGGMIRVTRSAIV